MQELLRMLAKASQLGISSKVTEWEHYYVVEFDYGNLLINHNHKHCIMVSKQAKDDADVQSLAFWAIAWGLENESPTQEEPI